MNGKKYANSFVIRRKIEDSDRRGFKEVGGVVGETGEGKMPGL